MFGKLSPILRKKLFPGESLSYYKGPFKLLIHGSVPLLKKKNPNQRREWRVLSTLAPKLNLDPWSVDYPFSVKPEKKSRWNS